MTYDREVTRWLLSYYRFYRIALCVYPLLQLPDTWICELGRRKLEAKFMSARGREK
jgi:hypothetical protein